MKRVVFEHIRGYNMAYNSWQEVFMSYKTIDGLMRHLRDNGIAISGSSQKRQLRNTI